MNYKRRCIVSVIYINLKDIVMFSIHKQTDYALLTIWRLIDRKTYVPLSELVKETGMPQRFLARITADLVRNNILKSKEGRSGGYLLAKSLNEISLYELLVLFEGDLEFVNCNSKDNNCVCSDKCGHKSFFCDKLKNILKGQLEEIMLDEVFEQREKR